MPKTAVKPTNTKNAHENENRLQPGHMPLCLLKMGHMPKMVEKH